MLLWQYKRLQIIAVISYTQTLQILKCCHFLVNIFFPIFNNYYSLSMKLYSKLPDPSRTHWRPQSIAGKKCSTANACKSLFYSLKSPFSGKSQQVLPGKQSLSLAICLITIPGEET